MGRAIVRDPQVFLFDEPLSNLDAKLRVQMRTEIRELHQRLGSTTVYVTHDQIEAMTMADKIVVMQNGHIEQIGNPLDVYDRPANVFVAGFIGSPSMNMIETTVRVNGDGAAADIDGTRLPLPGTDSLTDGQRVLLGIRPEKLELGTEGIKGQITVIEPTGSETHVVIRSHGRELVSVLRERRSLQVGQDVALNAGPDDILLFDHETEQILDM